MSPSDELMEILEYKETGYQPLIDFNGWRVAILNYLDEIQPGAIKSFERHQETDEVFVLLRGKGILFLGEGESKVERIYSQSMDPGKLYNIKKNVWHSVVLTRDGSVLIVENQNTGENNTQYSPLLTEHRQLIEAVARLEQPGEWEG